MKNPKGNTYKKYYEIVRLGIKHWRFEILMSDCSEEDLEKERHYIEFYDSYNNGYNLTASGKGFNIEIK